MGLGYRALLGSRVQNHLGFWGIELCEEFKMAQVKVTVQYPRSSREGYVQGRFHSTETWDWSTVYFLYSCQHTGQPSGINKSVQRVKGPCRCHRVERCKVQVGVRDIK